MERNKRSSPLRGLLGDAAELAALRVGRLDLLRGTAWVVEAGPEVDGTCLGWVKIHEARTVRRPRSIADELGGYLDGRPNDADALVFTAPVGRVVTLGGTAGRGGGAGAIRTQRHAAWPPEVVAVEGL